MQLNRSRTSISRNVLEQLLKKGELLQTAGRGSKFKLLSFAEDRVRIRPSRSANETWLRYDQLAAVHTHFEDIHQHRVGRSVSLSLNAEGLGKTNNSTYLYAMVQELRRRGMLPPVMDSLSLEQQRFQDAVTKSRSLSAIARAKRLANAPRLPTRRIVTTYIFVEIRTLRPQSSNVPKGLARNAVKQRHLFGRKMERHISKCTTEYDWPTRVKTLKKMQSPSVLTVIVKHISGDLQDRNGNIAMHEGRFSVH